MNSRRKFIQSSIAASTVVAALRLPALSRAAAQVTPDKVVLDSGIEPLVELIERTSREQLIETLAKRVRLGLSYQEVLAALMLAGVRNVEPRPAVGFKFHSVLVVHSAHLASLASSDEDRWLPIFWALDYFKSTQIEEERKSGWKLAPVNEALVPKASKARKAFADAMESWDPDAADVATAGLVRAAGANELFESFCRFGARDYRSIGHKAIYVANSFRTLQCIGWQHAEPVLRSLAYALQNHTGEANPAQSDHPADRSWRDNLELQMQVNPDWLDGKPSHETATAFVERARTGSKTEVAEFAVNALNQQVSANSIWDGVFLASGELLMRQPGIIGLHSLTTANALRYAFNASADRETRKLLLLQACAFVPQFRKSATDRGALGSASIDDLGADIGSAEPLSIEGIFEDVSQNPESAARKVFSWVQSGRPSEELLHEARRLVFLKGNDAHDYKFSSAVLEDLYQVSPALRAQFLALSVFNLNGSRDKDNQLVSRIRSALNV